MKHSRRAFVTLAIGLAASPLRLRAQARPKQVAFVIPNAENDPSGQARLKAFRDAMHELGWTEGRNVRFDYRWSAGNVQQAQAHAAELVPLARDAIFVGGTPALAAMSKATRTIPIVFVGVVDPLGGGFVESLARPGGNVTGFSTFDPDMAGKWLELLREFRPGLKRVAVLLDPAFKGFNALTRTIDEIGARTRINVIHIAFSQANDNIEAALAAFTQAPDGGMIVLPTATNNVHRNRIVAAAAKHRLPAIYPFREYAAAGGLMCYGFDVVDLFRRGASYVDRILRGAKPGDLPVQGPTRYELLLNLKTAKALGITFPQSLQLRADEVIE